MKALENELERARSRLNSLRAQADEKVGVLIFSKFFYLVRFGQENPSKATNKAELFRLPLF